MRVSALRHIDLRPRHMQKTQEITCCERARFVSVNHVIRNTGYLAGTIRLRTQSTKRTYDGHYFLPAQTLTTNCPATEFTAAHFAERVDLCSLFLKTSRSRVILASGEINST